MRIIGRMESFTGPCAYLPGRMSRLEILSGPLSEKSYGELLEAGWRRSGNLCYRNVCDGCKACMALRRSVTAPVSRRGRHLGRLNADVRITLIETCLDEERFSLYREYMKRRHGQTEDIVDSYLALIVSPLARFVDYRLATGRLVALGFVDVADRSLSSAYFAFDSEASRRSLGSFSVFAETALALSLGKTSYYLGYWVPGSPKMEYKADFPPFELLLPVDGKPLAGDSGDGLDPGRGWKAFASRAEAETAFRQGADR